MSIEEALPNLRVVMVDLTSSGEMGSFSMWGLGDELMISSALLIRDCLASLLIVVWLSEYRLVKNDSKLAMS